MNCTVSGAEAATMMAQEKSKEPGALVNMAVADRAARLKMTLQ